MFDLTGKAALVTGAGRGIGEGVAQALAAQGASVLVNDLVPERAQAVAVALRAAGARAEPCPFDVTDPAAIAVALHEASIGPVDVLVNNAGIPAAGMTPRPFRETPPEEWRPLIDLNLYGVLHCTRAVLDPMCERRWGRIVTISSEAGRQGLALGVSLYGAAKAGAIAFMRHLACEVGPFGVTANCVAVGAMDNIPAAFVERLVAAHPLRRVGTPADVAAAVVYLASPEAGWVTGQVLPVNGGYSAH